MIGRNRLAALLVVAALPAGFASGAATRPTVPSGFSENFDGVTAPALPAGWSATNAQGGDPLWLTDTTRFDTAPNAAHIDDPQAVTDKRLDSPSIAIRTAAADLTFRQIYGFSTLAMGDINFVFLDGGVLEMALDGGEFQDIVQAGGSFLQGGYDAGIWTGGGNPLAGRAAWVGGASWSTTVAQLPPAAAGHSIVLRWRIGSSPATPDAPPIGWWIDSIQICDGYPCDAIPLPGRLDVDTAGNGVLEPGESVDLDPYYYNESNSALILTGEVSDLDGPPGTVFHAVDGIADLGTISPGALGGCVFTENCYEVSLDVPATRPAQHWDGQFRDELSNGVFVTWALHVGESFPDVPTSNPFYAFIENVFHNGVTGGCIAGNYCPDNATLRKQMAVFVLKAKYGSAYVPPHCAGVFADVACPGPFTDWIEDLHVQGVVAGCGAGPTYCPDGAVSRQQMAVFLLKSLQGSSYVPPACQGIFPDVPCSGAFAPWIEDLYSRQIAAGCGNGDFCPGNPTTRGQMAPFLVKTFGLRLYGN
jgi:hypothetical protein